MSSSIVAVGRYVPQKRLTNLDLEKILDTSDQWIVTRTGMRERRIAADNEFTKDVAIRAVEDLVCKYPEALVGVDTIITASMTPDYYCPNVSSQVQAHFDIPRAGAIDVNCACSGFVYALIVGNGMIASGASTRVLVIGAETMSKILDYQDRTTCVLFGDGAGAVVLEANPRGDFLASFQRTEGQGGNALYCTGLAKDIGPKHGVLTQDGPKVFRWAVGNIVTGVGELLATASMSIDDIDWFVPHSANARIVDFVSDRLRFPRERVLSSLEYHANTASASIPLAFSEGVDADKIHNSDVVLLYGFGGGLSQAAVIIKLQALGRPRLCTSD
jgi:3-oxoacyl-[acyl-carrier-protein] synthase-3